MGKKLLASSQFLHQRVYWCRPFESLNSAKEKIRTPKGVRIFLSMGYEKDIFAVFAYEFELLHNRSFLVKSFAYAHSPSRRISHAAGVFHIAKQYFTHPQGWI